MPTYQYACTECGHAFEQFQSFSDDTLTECPECTGRLRKLFNAVGVVFKGSGFYRTDSRAGSSEKPSEGGAGSTAAKDGSSSSDSSSGGSAGSPDGSTGSSDKTTGSADKKATAGATNKA